MYFILYCWGRSSVNVLQNKMIGMHACNLMRYICEWMWSQFHYNMQCFGRRFPLGKYHMLPLCYDIMVLSHRKSLTKVCSRFPVSIGLLCPQSDRAVGERLEWLHNWLIYSHRIHTTFFGVHDPYSFILSKGELLWWIASYVPAQPTHNRTSPTRGIDWSIRCGISYRLLHL